MRSETAGHIAWTLPVRKAVTPPAEGHGEEEPVPRYLRLLVRLTSILIKVTEPSINSFPKHRYHIPVTTVPVSVLKGGHTLPSVIASGSLAPAVLMRKETTQTNAFSNTVCAQRFR